MNMRIALAIPTVTADWRINTQKMCDMAEEAAHNGAILILFSEAAVTGFINTGDPIYDLTLGQTVPGPVTTIFSQAAQAHGLWIGTGLFEHDAGRLYDTYIVISPGGVVETRYRRIDTHWHHWHSRPCNNMIYAEGDHIVSMSLPIGRTTFLLCGDLFNAVALHQVKRLQPDWLIVPMARGFDSEVVNQQQWYDQERYYYIERSKEANVNLLLVNQLAHCNPRFTYFGGAMVVTKAGDSITEYPLEQEGICYVDIE